MSSFSSKALCAVPPLYWIMPVQRGGVMKGVGVAEQTLSRIGEVTVRGSNRKLVFQQGLCR